MFTISVSYNLQGVLFREIGFLAGKKSGKFIAEMSECRFFMAILSFMRQNRGINFNHLIRFRPDEVRAAPKRNKLFCADSKKTMKYERS